MGKGRKVKKIVLRFKQVFNRCVPCCGSSKVYPDDGTPHSTTDNSVFNESSGFFQRRYIPMTAESLADPDLFRLYVRSTAKVIYGREEPRKKEKPGHHQILQASYSQLHVPSKYAGNQCTPAALYNLVMRTVRKFSSWDKDTMDDVLLYGTALHEFFREGIELTDHPDKRVSLYDLPEYVPVFAGGTCYVAKGTDAMVFGQVAREVDEDVVSLGDEFPKLCHYLQSVLSHDTSALVTVGEYTVAVAMEADRVWLFDSHSRDEKGMPDGFLTGKACIVAFADIDSLVEHLMSVYGRDQYCARSFTFHDLADDQVTPEDHHVQTVEVCEAEPLNQVEEDENSNQIDRISRNHRARDNTDSRTIESGDRCPGRVSSSS